jgi:diguanylate cyclase (GGDEF)-like protein
MVAICCVVAARVALWPTTDLIYSHRIAHGLPVYGPLMGLTGMAVIVLLFGYLLLVTVGHPSMGEQRVMVAGIVGSLILAVVSVTAGESIRTELATGYVVLPAILAVAVVTWMHQSNAFRLVQRLGDSQRTLAELGQFALSANLSDIEQAARHAVVEHVEQFGNHPARHAEFATAVGAVLSVATAQDQAKRELQQRATTDELTGLPNRSGLHKIIEDATSDAARTGSTIAIAFCDLYRFRTINDVYGHPAGDEVLQVAGSRLLDCAWPGEIVGRFGGDTFVMVSPNLTGDDGADAIGRRLVAAFDEPMSTSSVLIPMTVSVGVVTATPRSNPHIDPDTLLRDADTAMQDAKSRGAFVGRFDDNLRSAVIYQADLEQRLASAVQRAEIVLHFQPIVALPGRTIVGFEALARWQVGSQIFPPDQWIPTAESTGLIEDIGEEILNQAVVQLLRWIGAGHRISVSVNVSPRQLASPRFLESVRRCLAAGVPPELLTLEVTESLAIDDYAIGMLKELRRLGVQVAIDDFGTGYSTLVAVTRLPASSLKIDQSIVRRVGHEDGHAIAAAALGMASALNLSSIAEGIETADDERALIELGCPFGQGYFYARPMKARATWEALRLSLLPLQPSAT